MTARRLTVGRVLALLAAGGLILLTSLHALTTEPPPEEVTDWTVPGEWTGLAPEKNVLVTLRTSADGGRTLLAVAEHNDQTVEVEVYEVNVVGNEAGEFWIGERGAPVYLRGSAMRTWRTGWGKGRLELSRPNRPLLEATVYLFHMRDESWMRRVLQLRRRAKLEEMRPDPDLHGDGLRRRVTVPGSAPAGSPRDRSVAPDAGRSTRDGE